jgi:hypothetical protein
MATTKRNNVVPEGNQEKNFGKQSKSGNRGFDDHDMDSGYNTEQSTTSTRESGRSGRTPSRKERKNGARRAYKAREDPSTKTHDEETKRRTQKKGGSQKNNGPKAYRKKNNAKEFQRSAADAVARAYASSDTIEEMAAFINELEDENENLRASGGSTTSEQKTPTLVLGTDMVDPTLRNDGPKRIEPRKSGPKPFADKFFWDALRSQRFRTGKYMEYPVSRMIESFAAVCASFAGAAITTRVAARIVPTLVVNIAKDTMVNYISYTPHGASEKLTTFNKVLGELTDSVLSSFSWLAKASIECLYFAPTASLQNAVFKYAMGGLVGAAAAYGAFRSISSSDVISLHKEYRFVGFDKYKNTSDFLANYNAPDELDRRADTAAMSELKHVDPVLVKFQIQTVTSVDAINKALDWSRGKISNYLPWLLNPPEHLVSLELASQLLAQSTCSLASDDLTTWNKINQTARSLHTVNQNRAMALMNQNDNNVVQNTTYFVYEFFRHYRENLTDKVGFRLPGGKAPTQ